MSKSDKNNKIKRALDDAKAKVSDALERLDDAMDDIDDQLEDITDQVEDYIEDALQGDKRKAKPKRKNDEL
ncbi:MAG: hypothetical protein AAF846_22050 [Chloroflexota bacterium]